VRDEQWCPAGEMKPSHIQKNKKKKEKKKKKNRTLRCFIEVTLTRKHPMTPTNRLID
jgi:hypothetical protein